MADAGQVAYEAELTARQAVYDTLDALLTPASDAAATQTQANWQPIEDFQKEGPHVGSREFPESEEGQRVN